ncbi:MAG: hypothetical protein EA378_05700 [Phycisphaerales bacterium]|nr:MAG: hypothetical protein EA378_05700 [Phycisphaerales bacterium]
MRMAFTGKATYGAGAGLPELAEDVSDVIGIVSPHETPLLDHLGDPKRAATSTVHEWIEDALLPNTDTLNQTNFTPNPTGATSLTVSNGPRFRVGDLVRPGEHGEVMLITAAVANTIVVVRGYGGTTPAALANGMTLTILGNAALEGADADAARFTSRSRQQNYTQIFTKTIEVSGSMLAARQIGIDDELDYQKQERMRELLRDLENTVINGVAPESDAQGSGTVRRSMRGLVRTIQSNVFAPGAGGMPDGDGDNDDALNEAVLNAAMRRIWDQSSGVVDTIVVGGAQKRRINAFASTARAYLPEDTAFRDLVSVYESDYGVAKVVLSRWAPPDTVLLLDSTRLDVMPLQGRSFHYKPLAASGDAVRGQVVGEYTLEIRNENAHGVIGGLAV